jgi:hypothetical protein
MFRLAALFYIIIAPTLAGIGVTASLVVPEILAAVGIAGAAAGGALIAVPVSWFVARAIFGEARPL